MVNTKLDISICGPLSVFHFDPHPYTISHGALKHKFIRLPWCPPCPPCPPLRQLRQDTAGRCAMRTQRGGLDADPRRGRQLKPWPIESSWVFPWKMVDFSSSQTVNVYQFGYISIQSLFKSIKSPLNSNS